MTIKQQQQHSTMQTGSSGSSEHISPHGPGVKWDSQDFTTSDKQTQRLSLSAGHNHDRLFLNLLSVCVTLFGWQVD